MATLKYLNPSYVEGGSEPKYVSVPLLSTKNDEISIGTDTPGNKEKVWVELNVLPNGVYIASVDGTLTTPDDWDTSNNSNAVGVAVITNNCSFIIDKGNDTKIQWGGYGTEISELDTIDSFSQAQLDYDGSSNTDKIISVLGSSTDYAAGWCKNKSITFGDEVKYGYLPALGELKAAINNDKYPSYISNALSKIGGTTINGSHYYWSSTHYSRSTAYDAYWFNGTVDKSGKGTEDTQYCRPFYSLSSFTLGIKRVSANVNGTWIDFPSVSQDYVDSALESKIDKVSDGDGTKFLSDNGTYVRPPYAGLTDDGYMSMADYGRLYGCINPTEDSNLMSPSTSIAITLPQYYNYFYTYTSGSAVPISLSTTQGPEDRGAEAILTIFNKTTSDITQPLPNSSTITSPAESVTIPASGAVEISIRYDGSTFRIKI